MDASGHRHCSHTVLVFGFCYMIASGTATGNFQISFLFLQKLQYGDTDPVRLFPMVANQNVAKSKLDRRTHCCVLAICAIRRLLGKGDNRGKEGDTIDQDINWKPTQLPSNFLKLTATLQSHDGV